MATTIWDELSELDRAVSEMWRDLGPPVALRAAGTPTGLAVHVPATDVAASKSDLVVHVDLPGVDPEKDVSVSLIEGLLVIRGERREHRELKDGRYYRREISHGTFERRIPVPKSTTEKQIAASYKDGVLEVRVAGVMTRAEDQVPKQIPVKSG